MQPWLEKEDIETARKNGIKKSTLYNRYYLWGWDVEKAINEPIQEKNKYKKLINDDIKKILAENNISERQFITRLQKGWDAQRASTQKIGEMVKTYKYPKELVNKAISNGISYELFRFRVKKGWDINEACTKKPMTKSESAKLNRNRRSM